MLWLVYLVILICCILVLFVAIENYMYESTTWLRTVAKTLRMPVQYWTGTSDYENSLTEGTFFTGDETEPPRKWFVLPCRLPSRCNFRVKVTPKVYALVTLSKTGYRYSDTDFVTLEDLRNHLLLKYKSV